MKSGAELHTPLFRGAGLLDRVDYRLIDTPEDRDAVYLLRYKAYLHSGLILPSESRRVTDRFDEAPNVWIFGVHVDGELCSSLRVHVLTSEWRASYSTEVYGDILHPRLDRGEIFIDPARLVADPEKAKRFPELPYLTVRLGFLACDHFDADTGLVMVRPDHQPFYRRIFFAESMAEPRPFPGWHTNSASLMMTDFRKVREEILTRFPIMGSSAFERRMLFDRGSQHTAAARPVHLSVPRSPGTAASLV